MPDYLKILIPSIIGFLTTVCAAFLSARWAMRRAFKERWWERKEQAYSEIIEALHDLLRYANYEAEQYMSEFRSRSPKAKELASRYSEAYWNVQRITDIGPFIISNRAAEVLQKLRDRPKLSFEDDPTWEVREQEATHYREALNEIRICALKDLKI